MKIWETIEIPVYVLIVWSILSVGLLSFSNFSTIWVAAAGWVMTITVYGYLGYSVRKMDEGIGMAARAGAYAGVIVGLVGAIFGIVAYYLFPHMYTEQMAKVIEQGIAEGTAKTMISIGVYINLITGPVIGGTLGAAISSLTNWITK